MAMAVQGSRQQQAGNGGVKVKFIETQFISSDAASFKAVVQRLTGKSPAPSSAQPPAAAPVAPSRPRPCRPAFCGGAASYHAGGWADAQQAVGGSMVMPAKQEPHAASYGVPAPAAPRLEELQELCDFADLLYAAGGARRDAGGFPY
ncbi:hypothetical protein ACP4OV_012919 [Aristida adscensionis]